MNLFMKNGLDFNNHRLFDEKPIRMVLLVCD